MPFIKCVEYNESGDITATAIIDQLEVNRIAFKNFITCDPKIDTLGLKVNIQDLTLIAIPATRKVITEISPAPTQKPPIKVSVIWPYIALHVFETASLIFLFTILHYRGVM